MATMSLEPAMLAYFTELKGHEGRRINKILTHQMFLKFLLEMYWEIRGDTPVMNATWERIRVQR